MQTSEVDREQIRALAELRSPGHPVVSLYMDLDPATANLPRARQTQLDSLLTEAEQRLLAGDGESHEQRATLNASLERIRSFFAEGGLAAKSARGVAVFSSAGSGLFEAYRLPTPVEAQVVVADTPFVEPLLELAPTGRWGVLLVSRRAARILHGSAESLAEVTSLNDDVHRRHSQGGWSQARFQRGIEKETLDHVKRACEQFFHLHQRAPFEHVIVGGPREIWQAVDDHLHPYLRGRLAGHIEADVERCPVEEVLARAGVVMSDVDREIERELLDRLAAGLGTGDQAVAGRDEVLAALHERRVGVLLIAEGVPADEEIELAVTQAAETRVIRHHREELCEQGAIGALLRY